MIMKIELGSRCRVFETREPPHRDGGGRATSVHRDGNRAIVLLHGATYTFKLMDLRGLDVPKIKQNVMEKWRSGPELWPVKVIPVARVAELEFKRGGKKLDTVGGYFTCIRAVRGRTPEEMEDILGYARGYYKSGASIWKFDRLPALGEFELRGYTQLPGGETFDGIVLRRSDAPRPTFLDKQGKALTFIPGTAVEQWELGSGVLIPAHQIDLVMPGSRFTKWR